MTIKQIDLIFYKLFLEIKNNKNELPVCAMLLNLLDNSYTISTNKGVLHAEVLLIEKIFSLENYALFVTLEPCPLCLIELSKKKIKFIFFSLKNNIYKNSAYHFLKTTNYFLPKFFEGFSKKESLFYLKSFFQNKRK
jgi:tRNA(Arg) A34 adenosine deaminase TadA